MSNPRKVLPLSRSRRRVAAAAAVVVGLLGSVLVLTSGPGQAEADSVNSDISAECSSIIGPLDVDIPATVADNPDPVVAGQQMTISFTTGYPGAVGPDLTINHASATWPMPAEVDTVDNVTFSGGHANFQSTWVNPTSDTEVQVFFDAVPNTSGLPPTPTVNVTVTVDAGAGGQTIEWLPFTAQGSNATSGLFGTFDSDCTANNPAQVLNTTTVNAPGTTTTTIATTTTTSAPVEQVCTLTSSADGWTKSSIFGPGGWFVRANGTENKMYTTDDGLNYFRSFVKFAGAGGTCAEGGTMPSGVNVTDADLRLVKVKSCICVGPEQRVYRITQSWSESNLHPEPGPSVLTPHIATFSTPSLNQAAIVNDPDLTNDVEGWVNGTLTNNGVSIRQRYNGSGDTGNNIDPAGFATREHSTASYRPTLKITYIP